MPIYGTLEVQYFQVTPMGVNRLQSGTLKGVGPAGKQVLRNLVKLGGVAEVDELTVGGSASPMVVNTSLRRLVDLGLVTSVTIQQEGAPAVSTS